MTDSTGLPQHTPSAKVGRAGVTRTSLAVEEDLGWLFREHPISDYGIDAHIEVVDSTNVTGRLLAVQIKSGRSRFAKATKSGWWFYPKTRHVNYWMRHSLPVLIVIYDPDLKRCYWQLVNDVTLKKTRNERGYKLKVPADQLLDKTATDALSAATEGDPYELRIRQLRLALPWMKLLASGQRLVSDMEEWVNKGSGRGLISLAIDDENGQPPRLLAKWAVMLGLSDYAEVVPQMFAWADVDVHRETYEAAEGDPWKGEYAGETYQDWVETRGETGLRPYQNRQGEVDDWRLELTLGELGTAFMVVDSTLR